MTWQTLVQCGPPQPTLVPPLLVLSSPQRGETTLTNQRLQKYEEKHLNRPVTCSPYRRHSPSQNNCRLIDASINIVRPPRVRQ
ncbi:hypothetical protein EV2_039481 [Malus domestica]